MLSKASVEGRRIRYNYKLQNVRLHGKRLREPREYVSFRLRPSTIELNEWLALKDWAPPGKRNGARAIDTYVRRFYWLWVTPKKFPDSRRSTLSVINELVDICKTGSVGYFADMELIQSPNKGRMLDYLASFWYHYEGGKKATF